MRIAHDLSVMQQEMDGSSSPGSGSSSGSWSRLEVFLTGLRPGDVITVSGTVELTDLAADTIRVVLDALTRANLFDQHGDRFIRRRALRVS
jgi:hypothetical protein